MNIEKLNATITSSKVALSLTILTFDYKVAFSFSIGDLAKNTWKLTFRQKNAAFQRRIEQHP